jgi:hypothetical protein
MIAPEKKRDERTSSTTAISDGGGVRFSKSVASVEAAQTLSGEATA